LNLPALSPGRAHHANSPLKPLPAGKHEISGKFSSGPAFTLLEPVSGN
jgi:hypothetical protein